MKCILTSLLKYFSVSGFWFIHVSLKYFCIELFSGFWLVHVWATCEKLSPICTVAQHCSVVWGASWIPMAWFLLFWRRNWPQPSVYFFPERSAYITSPVIPYKDLLLWYTAFTFWHLEYEIGPVMAICVWYIRVKLQLSIVYYSWCNQFWGGST
jgi:hypothetical protein